MTDPKAKDMTNSELANSISDLAHGFISFFDHVRSHTMIAGVGPNKKLPAKETSLPNFIEAAARLRAMDWQPIESVPDEIKRDGTRILVYGTLYDPENPGDDGNSEGLQVYEASWKTEWYWEKEPHMQGWMIANCDEEYGYYVSATHWQPLHPPPKT